MLPTVYIANIFIATASTVQDQCQSTVHPVKVSFAAFASVPNSVVIFTVYNTPRVGVQDANDNCSVAPKIIPGVLATVEDVRPD